MQLKRKRLWIPFVLPWVLSNLWHHRVDPLVIGALIWNMLLLSIWYVYFQFYLPYYTYQDLLKSVKCSKRTPMRFEDLLMYQSFLESFDHKSDNVVYVSKRKHKSSIIHAFAKLLHHRRRASVKVKPSKKRSHLDMIQESYIDDQLKQIQYWRNQFQLTTTFVMCRKESAQVALKLKNPQKYKEHLLRLFHIGHAIQNMDCSHLELKRNVVNDELANLKSSYHASVIRNLLSIKKWYKTWLSTLYHYKVEMKRMESAKQIKHRPMQGLHHVIYSKEASQYGQRNAYHKQRVDNKLVEYTNRLNMLVQRFDREKETLKHDMSRKTMQQAAMYATTFKTTPCTRCTKRHFISYFQRFFKQWEERQGNMEKSEVQSFHEMI